jgi:hypothetical protein
MIVAALSLQGVVRHNSFALLSHGDVIHLTPVAQPVHGDTGALQEHQYIRL